MTNLQQLFNIKLLGSLATGIMAILGAIWAVDSHYASAADVQSVQRSVEGQIRALRQERIEDELFKLDIKKETQGGKLSPEDSALRERYIRKLKITEQENAQKDSK